MSYRKMLDRKEMEDFLQSQFEERGWKLPRGWSWSKFTEAFCRYVEADECEWVKDNFKCLFNHGDPQWTTVQKKLRRYLREPNR